MICLRKAVKVSLWMVKAPSPAASIPGQGQCVLEPLFFWGSLDSFFLVEAEIMFWTEGGMFRWGIGSTEITGEQGAGEPSRLAAFSAGPLYSGITLLCVREEV